MMNQVKSVGLLILMILTGIQNSHANTQQYSEMWKEYQNLENKGSNRDALLLAQKIYAQAEKDKKSDQQYKALIHIYKNKTVIEENSEKSIVDDLKKSIWETDIPGKKALLEVLLAHSYYTYYSANQYKIIGRTYSQELSDDFTMWDAKQFHEQISQLYQSALKEPAALSQNPLKDYSDILISGNKESYTVPFKSLLDLIYYQAIQYYRSDKISLTEASNQFEIDQPDYFASAEKFVQLKLKNNEESSSSLAALQLLQDWMKIYTKEKDAELPAFIDHYRLSFVNGQYVGGQRDELYAKSLENASSFYTSKESKALFKSELINLWNTNSEGTFSYTPVQIVAEAQKVIQQFPDTYGAKAMIRLINTLQTKELNVEMEEAVAPQLPFKVSVQYKNLSAVKYKLLQMKSSDLGNRYNTDETWKLIQKQKSVRTGTFQLPSSKDLLSHRIEFALDGLPAGEYALLVYTSETEKNVNEGKFTLSFFRVSDLAILLRENDKSIAITVKNRITGQFVNQAQVEVFQSQSGQKTDKSLLTAFSNARGEVELPKNKLGKYSNYYVKVQKGKDEYQIPSQYYYQNDYTEPVPAWNTNIQIYTDRAIYRPGQQVFFKGIAIESKEDSARPSVNRNIQVNFLDANYQAVHSQTFTTNEFGSISGFFKIPEGGLNGQFTLSTDFGSAGIAVEEYKRPTFEVKTLPLEGSFQLKDSIHVKGQAIAYSGANIANAEVRYLIQRKGYFPYWRYSARMIWPPYSSQSAVMASGTTHTDAEGNFIISFIAEPDKYKNDIYQYEITVDVQDISGEVRSTTTSVRVGKSGVQPNLDVDPVWVPKTASSLRVSSKNLQDVAVSSVFQISIQSLIPPAHPKKNRYWEAPDQFSMTEAEHNKLFPFDLYKENISVETWKTGAVVWSKNVEVKGDTTLNILPANLPEGMYRITSLIIDKKDTIRLERTYEVRKPLSPSVAPGFIKVSFDKTSYKPGDIAEMSFASDLKEAHVYAFITHKNQVLKDTVIHLKGEDARWQIPVTEAMKGNIILHYEVVAQNRNHSSRLTAEIPFATPEQLTYKWTSFRNKLLPGSKEQWMLQILDKDKNLVDAELLAALYDASLDQFVMHDYFFQLADPIQYWYGRNMNSSVSFRAAWARSFEGRNLYPGHSYYAIQYPNLNYFGYSLSLQQYRQYMMRSMALDGTAGGAVREESAMSNAEVPAPVAKAGNINTDADGISDTKDDESAPEKSKEPSVILRTNFNETAFFYPQLRKDASGNYNISFTIPDALTTWKFLAIAHTTDLKNVVIKDQVVTQKDLMIQLNKPRFVRMGDELYLNARVSNLTDKSLDVTANIVFRDAQTNEDITDKILKSGQKLQLQIAPRSNSRTEWMIKVPSDYEGLIFEVSASAGDQADGESDLIPVLENRILLTESTPIFISKKGKYDFNLKDYVHQSGTSQTKSVMFEYTAQPVWQALMALPFLNEQEDASATSLFYRYYAHSLAAYILKTIPESKTLLEAWKKEGSLKSALEKNQELKSVILEATPWLRDAQDETAQMQQLFKLLNDAEDHTGRDKLLKKLKELQNELGGITWYPGMPSNRYMTQNIILGFYQLQRLGVLDIAADNEIADFIGKGLDYLESEVARSYSEIKKSDSNYLKNDHLDYSEIQYLYLISHISGKKLTEAEKYYFEQAQKFGLQKSNYAKAAIALTLNRMNDKKTALSMLNAFKQSAVVSEKEGMYWKSANSYFWYHAPIETQAIIIQAFDEISNDTKTVDLLKIWLLRQKQTNRWEQPRATVDACYALLLTGGDWKQVNSIDVVTYDKKALTAKDFSFGTSYVKTTWDTENKEKAPAVIRIQKKTNTPSFGAIYHQYWEDLDKVKATTNELQVRRTIYKVLNTESGEKLIPVTESQPLEVGDKVRIRLELKIDRDMEFFHLQDARASGFEPANVLSGYRYQGGLGYYEVTGDAATHWYMDFIRKGNYVFEYTVFVNVAGVYSSGVTSGECLYAPEFRFQSNGNLVRINN